MNKTDIQFICEEVIIYDFEFGKWSIHPKYLQHFGLSVVEVNSHHSYKLSLYQLSLHNFRFIHPFIYCFEWYLNVSIAKFRINENNYK